MAQHKEEYFVIPMLKVLYFHDEPVSTEDIKKEIYKYCDLSDEDKMPYQSRSKNEPRYYQIVGNVISHNNANFFSHVTKIEPENLPSNKKAPDRFILNEKGKEYIKDIIQDEEDNLDGDFFDSSLNDISSKSSVDLEIDEANQRMLDSFEKNGEVKKPVADKNLSRVVLELTGYKCQIGLLLGEEHHLFASKNNEPYLEMHHLIPLKASKDFFPLNLDIAPNLVPLCPKCHAILHHGSIEDKTVFLRILYNKRIKALNENGIYISFDDLLEKYYI